MHQVTVTQKELLASLNAAVTWLLVWWTASVAAVAVIASLLPVEKLESEVIMSLSEVTPAINIWAMALRETPVMRVVWIYMTITSPFAIFYMLYKSQLKLFLLLDVRLRRLIVPTIFNVLIYLYMIVPMTVLGKSFGHVLFSSQTHDSLPTFGTRVILGSFWGGMLGSWMMWVAFCGLTVILALCTIRFFKPVINGVTHGIRRK